MSRFDDMVARIPGFCGKREDYECSIQKQAYILASFPPFDQVAFDIGMKHRLSHEQMHDLTQYLKAAPTKHLDHKRQVAVKWAKQQ